MGPVAKCIFRATTREAPVPRTTLPRGGWRGPGGSPRDAARRIPPSGRSRARWPSSRLTRGTTSPARAWRTARRRARRPPTISWRARRSSRAGTALMGRSAAPCLDRWIALRGTRQPRPQHPPRPRAETASEPNGSAHGSACGRSDRAADRPDRQTLCRAWVNLPVLAGQSEADLRHRAERRLPGDAALQHYAVPDSATPACSPRSTRSTRTPRS